MWLRILWLLLLLEAFTNATALASETDDEDVSLEDPSHPKQPFYDSNYDADDYYYRDKYKKPTISEDTIFLPHEKYCQYFYAFDGRDSYIYRCPSGYRFDAEKLQCLKTKQVSCGKRKKDTDSSEEKRVGLNFKCPKWSGAHPHSHYCHLFYYCQNKKPSLFMCPPGKLFDKKINGCLPQNQVKCEKRENPYEDEDPEDVSLPDPESNTQYQCPDLAGVYPDAQYCHKYIRCWYGSGELYVCPKGKLYDEDLQRCRSKNSVYCYDKINPYVVKDDEEPTVIDEYPDFNCRTNFGRFPHEDCSQFYQCEGGYARLFKCPNEKMFDSDSGSCKIASEVTCNKETKDEDNDDEFVCPAREGVFKDEEDCGSYYKCKKGKAQRLQCPEGELFDTDWKSCSDENEVTCGDRPLPGDDDASGNEEESVIDENPPYTCEQRHGRFTHKDYCTWFYHCKDGRPSVRSCRGGKYYDSYRRNCYDQVDCGSRKPKPDYEITTPKPREFSCPAKSGKFVDPRDCGAYYVCEKYKHKLHQCPKGKLFHDKWLVCSNENQVDCGNRAHPDVDPEDRENKVVDPNPKFECKAKYGQYDHEEYCDWYYNCHDSKATLRECRRGKYYDSHRRKCYQSKEVSCGRRRKPEERDNPTTTEKTITTKRPEFRCPQEKGKFPHERDCSKFYECKKWSHKEHKCPKHKLFDSRRQSCEDDDHVICDERIHPDMDPDEPEDKVVDPNPRFSCKNNYGRFTHDEYCHWYYNCHNKKATVRECRHGRYYDSRRRKCYDSKEVSCDGRKKPDDGGNLKTTTEDYITSAPEFQCPKGEGKYPHERDCGKFYECKQWRYKVHNCPKHQLFNEKSKKCEPEEKVTCGNRIHPEDDPEEPEDKVVDPNPDFSCPSNFGRFDHRNCDYYYHCKDRRPSVRECRRGKYYDRNSRKCKNSIDVDCKDRIRPEDRVTYKPEKSTTISEETSTTTRDETTTTKQPITKSSTIENDPMTTTRTYPDENTGRTETQKSTTEKSTTLSSINTEPSVSTSKETPEPKVTTQTTEEPTTEFDDNPDKIIDREPDYECGGDEGDFAHDSYCHYYYSCKNNKVTLRECPEGKYFDIDRGYCEDWYMVSCGDRLTPEELGSTFDEFQSTPYIERRRTTIFREKTTTEEPVSVKPKFDCPSDGFYPHETYCEKYYVCTNGVAEEKVCPEKQLYDVEKKACNEEQETNCGKRIHPNDDPSDKVIDPNPDFNCTDRHGCWSHERICKWYYYCHDNRPEVRECSGDRYFDSQRNKCLEWWMVFCEDRIVPEETTIVPTTTTSITSSRNTFGPSEQNTEDMGSTSGRTRTTGRDIGTRSTGSGDYGTGSTPSDRVTGYTGGSTTDDGRGTHSTRDRSGSTSSGRVTGSTEGRTRTTGRDIGTRSTGTGSYGTGSTPSDRVTGYTGGSTTDDGKGTRSTRDRGGSTSSGRVTGSTEGRTKTTGRDIGTRSTGIGDYGTGSTPSDRVTGYTGGSTTDDGRGTRSTRDRGGSTSSGRVTGSTEGRTRTTGRDIGTRSTGTGDYGTGSTPSDIVTGYTDGRGTRSTRDRGGSTSSGRVTGSTEGRARTTGRDIGTRSTGTGDYGTGSTPSDRVTGYTGGSTTDDGRGTRSTRDRGGSTSSGRVTGSTEERTRTTDIGTRSTGEEDKEMTTGVFTTPSDIADKCKEEDGDFEHPDDCSKFIVCKDGEYTIDVCPSGMLFDKNRRICDREERVDCDDRKKPEVTTDDCDEWLRTSTTADNLTTQPRKETTGTTNKGTRGTETASSGTKEETESDSSNPSSSSIATEPTNDTEGPTTESMPDSTSSDFVSENFSGSTPINDITSETGITGDDITTSNINTDNTGETDTSGDSESTDENSTNSPTADFTTDNLNKSTLSTSDEVTDNDITTKENSSKEPTDETEEWQTKSTNVETSDTDATISTDDDNKEGTGSTLTTKDNESEDSTITTVTILDPTSSTTSDSGENTDSSDTPTSTDDDTETKTSDTTKDNESGESTIKTVTELKPTVSTTSESGENTDSTDKESGTSVKTSSTDNSKEATKTISTSEMDPTTDNISTIKDETTESTSSESEPTTDDQSKTEDSTAGSTYTPEGEPTNDNLRSTGEETSTDPSGESTISETTNNETTDDETLETRIISERTPREPEASTLTSTQGTENSIITSEVSSSTGNPSTDDNRTEYPSTTESETNASSTDDLETESNTDDRVSEATSTITTAKDIETTSKPTTTTSNEGGSTDTETKTTEHTTMHPCLTHTHQTALPTEPTKIDCDNDDIDCIERKTGNIEKWYKCPKKQGHFPHPYSNRIFIRCRDWKPRVKKCSRRQIFSPIHMRCIHLIH